MLCADWSVRFVQSAMVFHGSVSHYSQRVGDRGLKGSVLADAGLSPEEPAATTTAVGLPG